MPELALRLRKYDICATLLMERGRYWPIFVNICSCLEIDSIIALTRTCKALSGIYRELLPHFWNINKTLKRFVKDPKDLRSQMAAHDALIQGSFVIQFLDRVEYPDSDLDFFVQRDIDRAGSGYSHGPLTKYLLDEENYTIVERENSSGDEPDSPEYAFGGYFKVLTLTRSRPGKEHEEVDKIQIIESDKPPILQILNCWCTAVINVISWNKVYGIYPKETFVDRKFWFLSSYSNLSRDPDNCHLIEKYHTRGWQCQSFPIQDYEKGVGAPHPFGLSRMLGGPSTWQIELSTDGVQKSNIPVLLLETIVWDFDIEGGEPWGRYGKEFWQADLKSKPFFHPCLKHTHYFGACTYDSNRSYEGEASSSWIAYVTQKLDKVLASQLEELEPQDVQALMKAMLRMAWEGERATYKAVRNLIKDRGGSTDEEKMSETSAAELKKKPGFTYCDDLLADWFGKWYRRGGYMPFS